MIRLAISGAGAITERAHLAAFMSLTQVGVASVSGRVARLAKSGDVEDNGAMVLNFRSGAIGVIEASWTSRPPLSAIEIYGSDGRIMAGYPRLDIVGLRAVEIIEACYRSSNSGAAVSLAPGST